MVVQDTDLFDPSYPTVLVVPMTGDPGLAIAELTVELQPSASNGCKKVSYLLPQHLTCVAKTLNQAATVSRISATELQLPGQLIHACPRCPPPSALPHAPALLLRQFPWR